MPDTTLHAVSPCNGFDRSFDTTRVWESSAMVMMSIALPRNGRDTLNKQLHTLCGLSFPDTGTCLRCEAATDTDLGDTLMLLGLQRDQCLLVAERQEHLKDKAISCVYNSLGEAAYITDQSDSMAILNIHGKLAIPALERLCMLDLNMFDKHKVARTSMEHLSVIIEMPAPEHIRLYAPRSSANSFLHAITTALSSVSSG